MTRHRVLLIAVLLAVAVSAAAQSRRPQLNLEPTVETSPVTPGAKVHLALRVIMPAEIHVQANKPRDPALIPTVLRVQAPKGVTVDSVTYPEPKAFLLAGSKEPLLVYGPEFTIDVNVTLAPGVADGELLVPATLRYQACNDQICFAPARATTDWAVPVEAK